MTIAILGGGILGSCTALELADRGARVVLFERNAELLSEASLHNEGKLHLGYVYAADDSFRTAERMIGGAGVFLDVLSRWIPGSALDRLPARPFDYVVHRDTMVPIDAIEEHFRRVERRVAALAPGLVRHPYDRSRPAWRRLTASELESSYDPAHVVAAYETNEIAVDPWEVARGLRAAIASHPAIEVRTRTIVDRAERRADGRLDVLHTAAIDGAVRRDGPFDAVFNALWANRPLVDQRIGVPTGDAWYTRFKVGVNLLFPTPPRDIPSMTVMLGPFGDVVVYESGRVYLSWYPVCMLGTSTTPEYIDWEAVLGRADHGAIRDATIAGLAAICPALSALGTVRVESIVNGGAIFALGRSDIDDPVSRLHERREAVRQSETGYLSVDTCKYTLGPATALDASDRLMAMRSSHATP